MTRSTHPSRAVGRTPAALALLTVSAALLTACSSGSTSSTGTLSPGSTVSAGPVGLRTTAPAATILRPAPSTSSATATTTAPTGSVTPAEATLLAAQALAAAAQAQSTKGSAAAGALDTAFTGIALRAYVADGRVASIAPQLTPAVPAITAERPGVLAISKGAAYPHAMVVQTMPQGSLYPVLYLLSSSSAASAQRIAISATMLPGASVSAFAPLETGSALLPPDQPLAGGAVSPAGLLASYAKGLSFPVVKVPGAPYRSGDRFASQLGQHASEQAAAVKAQADFTQKHTLVAGSVVAVAQADGGALVFGALQRTDAFAVKKTQKLLPSPALKVFEPRLKTLTKKAELTTLELVVFEQPASRSSQATLVAATEHLVDGSGS